MRLTISEILIEIKLKMVEFLIVQTEGRLANYNQIFR